MDPPTSYQLRGNQHLREYQKELEGILYLFCLSAQVSVGAQVLDVACGADHMVALCKAFV